MESSKCDIPVIAGPTAVGKTELALRLADLIGGEIINMDSRQIFRRMNIGAAKPSADEMARVRHHLVDVADPGERYTVDDFLRGCRLAIADIVGRGARPIIVGGAPFYLFSLMGGLDFCGADSDAEYRAELRREEAANGREAMHARLADVDPESAAIIHPNDSFRVIRALEIHHLTGEPASKLRSATPPDAANCEVDGHRLKVFMLYTERKKLYDLINQRSGAMFDAGLVGETEDLLLWNPECRDFLLKTIGYAQSVAVLEGTMSLEKAIAETAKFTRRFAKRQLTWFRSMTGAEWLERGSVDPESLTVS